MARNKVQFQKGLSEAEFDELYGTEERCHAELARLRWHEGFECPGCGVQGLRGQARRAPAIPMQRLPQADLGEGGDYFRIQQAAAAALVQSHVSGYPIEERNLQHRVGASARRHADDRLDDETQARSG